MNFTHWLRTALPGSHFVYHIGLLMADRQIGDEALAVDMAGRLAWRAYESKRVALTQRRLDKHNSQYVATRL